eukprot:2529713-Prorocentrum_lima.AAC.1
MFFRNVLERPNSGAAGTNAQGGGECWADNRHGSFNSHSTDAKTGADGLTEQCGVKQDPGSKQFR